MPNQAWYQFEVRAYVLDAPQRYLVGLLHEVRLRIRVRERPDELLEDEVADVDLLLIEVE
jgi:hypothetical protein